VTQIDDDTRRRAERARRVGLFRYELIQEVIDPALSTRMAMSTLAGPGVTTVDGPTLRRSGVEVRGLWG